MRRVGCFKSCLKLRLLLNFTFEWRRPCNRFKSFALPSPSRALRFKWQKLDKQCKNERKKMMMMIMMMMMILIIIIIIIIIR